MVVLDTDHPSLRERESPDGQRLRLRLSALGAEVRTTTILLSRNLSDFRKISGLKVEDWTVARNS